MGEGEKLDLIAIGSIVQDVLYKVDSLPGDEGLADILEKTVRGGGVAANFSVAFTKMGGRAGIVSSVGDGPGARWLLDRLGSLGIDTSGVRVRRGSDALRLHIFEDRRFRRIFFLENRSVLRLGVNEIDEDYLSRARVSFADFFFGETSAAALKRAKSLGKGTVAILPHAFDVMETWGLDKKTFLEAMDHIDILFLSEKTLLSGFPEEWRGLLETFSRKGLIVVTLGSRGAIALVGDRLFHVEALKVEARDTTGAGDTFAGVFTYFYLIERKGLEEALVKAAAAAALKCTRMGAWLSPYRAELERLLSVKKPNVRKLEDLSGIYSLIKQRRASE